MNSFFNAKAAPAVLVGLAAFLVGSATFDRAPGLAARNDPP